MSNRTLILLGVAGVVLYMLKQSGQLDALLSPGPAPIPQAPPPPTSSGTGTADLVADLSVKFADAFNKVVSPFVTNAK
jgi:hypothetical protein